jgi:hypothetical protein
MVEEGIGGVDESFGEKRRAKENIGHCKEDEAEMRGAFPVAVRFTELGATQDDQTKYVADHPESAQRWNHVRF